jgi:hypothetical protein
VEAAKARARSAKRFPAAQLIANHHSHT